MISISMANKIVLITGGGAGIGRAVAEAFGELGAKVIVADNDPEHLEQIRSYFSDKGWELQAEQCDVRRAEQVNEVMKGIEARHGQLDVLVNNVGDILGIIKPLEAMTDEEIDSVYEIILKHVFVCTRAAIPLLKKAAPGSSVISISSIEGYRGLPNLVPYASFKLAIEGFTKSLALELGTFGIRVNAIAPETTETRQIRPSEWIAPEHLRRVKDWIPLGRFGRPQDIAGCAVFLATDLAAWVTGTVVHCDGGALAAAGWYRTKQGQWTNTPLIEGSGLDMQES